MSLVDIIGSGVCGAALMAGFDACVRRLGCPTKSVDDGSVQWLCRTSTNNLFACPKCLFGNGTPSIGQICECCEYSQSHFHFACTSCGFKAIMRTADDR
jgi:hypothetical protein